MPLGVVKLALTQIDDWILFIWIAVAYKFHVFASDQVGDNFTVNIDVTKGIINIDASGVSGAASVALWVFTALMCALFAGKLVLNMWVHYQNGRKNSEEARKTSEEARKMKIENDKAES